MLNRLARRLKKESSEQPSDANRLAVRVLNPQRGDGEDILTLAQKVDGIQDPSAAVAGLDSALADRLAGDPRLINAAVRWLAKNARIHIAKISDPHIAGEDDEQVQPSAKSVPAVSQRRHRNQRGRNDGNQRVPNSGEIASDES